MRISDIFTRAAVLVSTAFFGAASHASTPEARVQAFIADFAKLHAASADLRRRTDFEQWSAAVRRLDRIHFVEGGRSGLDGTLSDHLPKETIIRSERDGHGAVIETALLDAMPARYYEYELRERDGDWRIVRLRSFLASAEEPFLSEQERARFRQEHAPALGPLPEDEAGLDGEALFSNGRLTEVEGQSSVIEVRRVGTLKVGSGILVVGDLGYDSTMLQPLSLRISPGEYAIDVSVAFERVAAMRLRVSDQPVVRWHPADGGGYGHVVGVDAGNVFISDVDALLAVTTRHKDSEFDKLANDPDMAGALMLHLSEPDDAVVASSGYGDGAYPVYWGLDAAGDPAVLLVDMLVVTQLPNPYAADPLLPSSE